MNKFITLITFALINTQAMAQLEQRYPQPAVGWDSLQNTIAYPEIARRAGLQAYVDVSVEVDSACNVVAINVVGYDIFHAPIEKAIKSLKWLWPEPHGIMRSITVFFTVEFNFKSEQPPERRILHVVRERQPSKSIY